MPSTETRTISSVESATVNFSELGKKPKAIVYLQIIHAPVNSLDTFPNREKNSSVY